GEELTGTVDPNMDPAEIEKQREEMGWNDPWYEQYSRWIGGVVQGDFGKSFRHKLPVTELLGQRLMNTIWLSVVALIITYIIAIPLGIISGRYNDRFVDQAIADRKSTRLNSSHVSISYAVFCFKKKNNITLIYDKLTP